VINYCDYQHINNPDREQWLNKIDALKDEWIIKRRMQLLIGENKIQRAKDLLLSTP
jgi:hypothetical protein